MDEATSIEDFEHKQKHCEGLRQRKFRKEQCRFISPRTYG